MALLVLLVLLLGLPAMSLASSSGTTPADKSAARAALKIVGIEPVTVAGRAFKSGERVRVSADGRKKTVTAGTRGGFKVIFPQANVCNGLVVVARGSEGSRATVTFANFSNVHCLEP
jgi:hypothetical protein